MTTFTFQGPDGKTHTSEGSTAQDAFEALQQKLGPSQQAPKSSGLGDLWDKALSYMPESTKEYARQLAPSWTHTNAGNSNPLKPADPNNMPNDAVNPVGHDTQLGTALAATGAGAAAAGALEGGGAAAATGARAAPGPGFQAKNPFQMPLRVTEGPPVVRGPGGKFQPNPMSGQPSGIAPTAPPSNAPNPWQGGPGTAPPPAPAPAPAPANPIAQAPPLPGTTPAQAQLIQQAVHGLPMGANPVGGLLGAGAKALGLGTAGAALAGGLGHGILKMLDY